jgi:hypothetical protein
MLGEGDGLGVTVPCKFKVWRRMKYCKNQSISINNLMTDLLLLLYYKYWLMNKLQLFLLPSLFTINTLKPGDSLHLTSARWEIISTCTENNWNKFQKQITIKANYTFSSDAKCFSTMLYLASYIQFYTTTYFKWEHTKLFTFYFGFIKLKTYSYKTPRKCFCRKCLSKNKYFT